MSINFNIYCIAMKPMTKSVSQTVNKTSNINNNINKIKSMQHPNS